MNLSKIGLWVGGICAVLGLLAFLGVHIGGNPSLGSISPAGQVQTNTTWFTNGIYAGGSQQFSVDSSGNITQTGTATTTLTLTSSTKGSCLAMTNSAGSAEHAYIVGTSWVIASGACQ
jgi:hypothetical protein